MRRTILSLLFLMTGVVAITTAGESGSEQKSATVAKEMESFAGTWQISSVKPEGATRNAKRLVFNKDGTYAALDAAGKELWAGTFEIDPTTVPKVWDHRSHESKKEGTDVLGIYQLDGDRLKVECVAGKWSGQQWMGKPRPKRFDSNQVDVTISLERIRSER